MKLKVGDKLVLRNAHPLFELTGEGDKVFEVYDIDNETCTVKMKCVESEDDCNTFIVHNISNQRIDEFFEKLEEPEEDDCPCAVCEDVIDCILEDSEIIVTTVFDKATIVSCKLPNGFIITESSACVDPSNYDKEIGVNICMERIRNKLISYEAYLLHEDVYHMKKAQEEEDAMYDMEAEDCEHCPFLYDCIEGNIF